MDTLSLTLFFLGLMFYPGSSAVILAYDVTRRDTLDTCLARDTALKEMEKGGKGTW